MKIHWRLGAVLIWGMFLGAVLAVEGFKNVSLYEPFTLVDKIKVMFYLSSLMFISYLAGQESKE